MYFKFRKSADRFNVSHFKIERVELNELFSFIASEALKVTPVENSTRAVTNFPFKFRHSVAKRHKRCTKYLI